MTVLEPTPERASRARLLRRVLFAATTAALSAAFALTLTGIASTQGRLRPNGQAAALVAAAHRQTSDASTRGTGRHHCHRGDARGRTGAGAGRV
jgi:hypothetical protein